MANAGELISNKGTAALGFGANADVPVGTNTDLDAILRIGDNIMYHNMAQNKAIYDQKIKDRDELLKNLTSGQLKVGDLLEDDMPYVRESLDEMDVAWANMIAKGKNDLNAQLEYRKATREAQDRITQAEARKVVYDTETDALSKETLPRKQSARQKHLDSLIRGNFWADLKPYQQTQDLDIEGSILSGAERIVTPYTDPLTLTKGNITVFDYGKTFAKLQDWYLNDANKAYDQQQLIEQVQGLPEPEFNRAIISMNRRIDEYNAFKGLKQGDEGFVDQAQGYFDPKTGRGFIIEKPTDFAAKWALAHEKPFESTTSEFDKDRANYLLGLERNKIAAQRARAYAALTYKKLNQLNQQEKDQVGLWNGVVDRIKELKIYRGKESGNEDMVLAGDLPGGYQYIGGVSTKGTPVRLYPKVTTRKDGSKFMYYETKYRNGQTGEEVDKQFLRDKYNEYKTAGGSGNFDAYLKNLVRSGAVGLELIGQDKEGNAGTADFQSAMQSGRALSNKLSTDKEPEVFEDTGNFQVD